MSRRHRRGSAEDLRAGSPHRPEEVLAAIALVLRRLTATAGCGCDSCEHFARSRDLPPAEPGLRHQIRRRHSGWVAVVVLLDPHGRIVARVDAHGATKMDAAVRLGSVIGQPMDWVRR